MVATEKKKLHWEVLEEREQILKRLVDRLCTLPAQENALVGAAAIRDELWRFLEKAASADHATRAVDALMEPQEGKAPWRPTGVLVRDELKRTPVEPPAALREPDPNCDLCGGTGVVFVERATYSSQRDMWYSGTRGCDCRKVAA